MRRAEHGISKPGEPKRIPAKGRECSIPGCDNPMFSRLLCRKHYRRAAKGLPVADVDDGKVVGITRSGRSYWGVVEHDGERLVCHECGKSYLNLAVHIAMTHGPVREYRITHGLTMRQPLRTERLQDAARARGRQLAENLTDARSPRTLGLADAGLIVRGQRISSKQQSAIQRRRHET
jgi:hypothetical protein